MKKTGIIDHFEGDYIYVEIGEDTVKIPREGAPAMLAEGTVVYRGGRPHRRRG